MTSEQFIFQEQWRLFEKFNRDYHILLAAKNNKHRQKLDINAITNEVFGFSADDYIAVLLIVLWLCSQNPEPLALKALAAVYAEYLDLRQAFQNAHQRVNFCRQTRLGHHRNVARLDTEKDRLVCGGLE